VLFLIGILGLVLSVIYTFYWSRSHARANAANVNDERDPRY
jgi:hypothetical protein